jgi:polyisoprenoid-binding protein YceI
MLGIIDHGKKTFAFTVNNTSFNGFNSALQREHFNENYLESDKYPAISFKGKIIEDVDFEEPGTYHVRAKGYLSVHGVVRERIIKGMITVKPGSVHIESRFNVLLNDHNIRVPKVVHEKIASEIIVEVKAELQKGRK